MGKAIIILLFAFSCSFSYALKKEVMVAEYSADVNRDGKIEHLIHQFYGGTGAYGILQISNNKGGIIFKKEVQGDPYLEDPCSHSPGLNPRFFKDLDKDGTLEILIGHQQINGSIVDNPFVYDIYRWNGKEYLPVSFGEK